MRRTSSVAVAVAAVLGAGAGFLLDQLLTAAGRPTFVPAFTLPLLLLVVGVIVVALAIPIRRATRGTSAAPVDPFRALRIAMLAKASTLLGAAAAGLGVGLVAFALTRPVMPSVGSVGAIIATAVCGAVLVVAGLVAEQLCTIRKDDDDDDPGAGDAGLPPHRH